MKFKKSELRERKQQFFDKENITLTMAGKTFNLYDSIQEAREDTEIYPTLEKYGCLPGAMNTPEEVYNFMSANVSEIPNKVELRDVKEAEIKAENLFYQLPLEIRNKFNNSVQEFNTNGKKFFQDYIKEYEAKNKQPEPITTPTETTTNE